MYLESEIMMRVLEKLRHQNIVGLPVFDGVIVKASKAEAAKDVMKEQFNKATELEIQVRLEHGLVPKVIRRTLHKLSSLATEEGEREEGERNEEGPPKEGGGERGEEEKRGREGSAFRGARKNPYK